MSSDHISSFDFIDDDSIRKEAIEELVARIANSLVDSRPALADFAPDADEFQMKVVEARSPTLRMLAPAGSGKTQTIINRVLHRFQSGTKPSRILVLTFDNAAATALREKLESQTLRLADQGEDSQLGDLTLSTLNAFGFRLLRERFPEEHRQVVATQRQHGLMRDSLDSLKAKSPERHASLAPNLRTRVYLDFFSLLKNEMFDPRALDAQRIADFILGARQSEPFLADPKSTESTRFALQALVWLFQTYNEKLAAQHLMDFDDQKLRPFVLLTGNKPVCEAIQSAYDEVVVDEFQDINRLDFELIKLIAEKADLTVTGDDDQAIYGFRGSSPEYIINLDGHLRRPVESYELRVNYRCPPNIVDHADRLIRHNKRRVAKDPIAARTDPAAIKVVASQTAGGEAQGVVAFVNRVRQAQPALGFDDFAVLYRTNAQSLPLQVEFILNGIPYSVRSEDNILKNEALDKLLALLRLKLAVEDGRQPSLDDQVAAIGSYFAYWSREQSSAARRVLANQDSFQVAIASVELTDAVPKVSGRLADAFNALLTAKTLSKTLEVVAERFKGVRGMIGSLEDAMTGQAPLGEVFELASHFGGSLKDFVSTVEAALKSARQAHAGDAKDGVSLLTYFKSKGRQWHSVILTSCNERLIPDSRADIEDERRLFYVGMTRASSNLMVSYLAVSMGKKVAPSRFLAEAGLL